MNHAITVGDVLHTLGLGVGVIVAIAGLLIWLDGAFANLETGESDGATCRAGCIVFIIGVVLPALSIWLIA